MSYQFHELAGASAAIGNRLSGLGKMKMDRTANFDCTLLVFASSDIPHIMPSTVNRTSALRLLFVSTPVGAIGSGLGGGVELTLRNIAQAMQQRGHQVTVLAPENSCLEQIQLIGVAGQLQPTAQTQTRQSPICLPDNAVLANLWQVAFEIQDDYDLICNFSYDWLPFYLSPVFRRPIAHLVSMGSLTDAMDHVIGQTLDRFPGTIGMHTRAQADTFSFGDRCCCLENGLDLACYQFQATPADRLAWVGRIAPEKGLEDAIAAAMQVGLPLYIWGAIPDLDYWQTIEHAYPAEAFSYQGFQETQTLQQGLGQCRGLLMTPKWVEAFGNVAIEALACGVPVIAYRRGGPAEIVEPGKTGWLVEPDQVTELVAAIQRLDQIDRQVCRQQAEARFSLTAMGDRIEAWLTSILSTNRSG